MALSEVQHGALIVFEREAGLASYIETGIKLEAYVTPDLLMTIFYPSTALHDGAVIIRGDKIVAAATVLPLGGNLIAHKKSLGTRHRAALGITESTDAVVVVVSEETGLISMAHNGQLYRGLDKKRLDQLLRTFYKDQIDGNTEGAHVSHGVFSRFGRSSKSVVPVQSQTEQQ